MKTYEMETMPKVSAKIEMALMTRSVFEVEEGEEEYAVNYLLHVFGHNNVTSAKEVLKSAFHYLSKNVKVKFMSVNVIMDMAMIAFVMVSDEPKDELPSTETQYKELVNEEGILCYVYNMDAPDCSELGYSFFDYDSIGFIRRIG